MAIAFVNGAGGGVSANVVNKTVAYSPTAGNTVCVFITLTGAVTNLTCVDNNSNPLAAGPTIQPSAQMSTFYYTAGSGVTSFACSWTTARQVNMIVVEYSGVLGGVNPSLSGNTANGTSTTATISVTTQDNNDFIVGGLGAVAEAITMTTGTSRETEGVGGVSLNVADNTVASAGSVSLTGTLTSAAWIICVLELRSVAVSGGGGTSNWLSKAVSTGVNKHS
jgi:hypothetical protein